MRKKNRNFLGFIRRMAELIELLRKQCSINVEVQHRNDKSLHIENWHFIFGSDLLLRGIVRNINDCVSIPYNWFNVQEQRLLFHRDCGTGQKQHIELRTFGDAVVQGYMWQNDRAWEFDDWTMKATFKQLVSK
jgi:hypothetical protein